MITEKLHEAKVTIELQDGATVVFKAFLHVRDLTQHDPEPSLRSYDRKWRDDILPEPPRWKIEGTTIGSLTMTLK